MIFFEDLIPLRLYSNKKRVYAPINEKDKKHKAAIFLMGASQEHNEKMMNAPFLYNPQNLFRAYYIDRDVMTYINSDAKKDFENEEEFDQVKEAVLSEGMMHTNKIKFSFENASTMDEKILKNIFNKDNLDYALKMLNFKESPIESFEIIVHPNTGSLKDSYPEKSKGQFYSFTNKSKIHLLSYYVYNDKSMDGPYDTYCRHELIYCLIVNQYPNINRSIARSIAMALSGQVKYLHEEKKKIEFNYADTKKENIDGLYMADLISQIYDNKGPKSIDRLLKGDLSDLRKVASGRIISNTKKLFESAIHEDNLSSKERNNLKDSDFGIPGKRKYPMPDASHVKAAIRMFNHCDPEDEAELAKNIKSKMKKYNLSIEIGDNNRLSKYINESASIEEVHPGIEYADNGELFGANYSEDYYAIQHIIKDFSKEEFDRISFYSTYKESEWIKKRIVLRDNNNIPMSFMDIYHFPSDPERAQITTAVSKAYRCHHLCSKMFENLINSGFAEENGIKKYIWHVHPGNDTSEHIAQINGFKLGSKELDKYGRYTYVYEVDKTIEDAEIILPSVTTESGYLLNESSAFIFNEFNEMNIKNDAKLKKYLYKERLKNAREVTSIYDQVKARNPKIDRTFRSLHLYKELNIFVDTSYYHALYLKNVPRTGGKRVLNMYFDFLSRLMIEDKYRNYNKITYFFPVQPTRNGESVDDLLNYQKDLNPLSMITYFAKKEPEMFNRWNNLNIIFIGDNGYFKIDFKDFNMNKLMKFKRNINKLLSHDNIIDEDESDDISINISSKAATNEIIDTIERNSRISITDISAVDNINISHLSLNDTIPKIVDNSDSSAIMILSPNSNTVISEIDSKALKSKDIKVYYKPKM